MEKQLIKNRELIEKSKGDIYIDEINFNNISYEKGSKLTQTLKIENLGYETRKLKDVYILQGKHPAFLITSKDEWPIDILPNKKAFVDISIQLKFFGVLRTILTFEFEGFGIGRFITIKCGNNQIEQLVAPKAPYQKKQKTIFNQNEPTQVDEGQLPKIKCNIGFKNYLQQYNISQQWQDNFRQKTMKQEFEAISEYQLCKKNYKSLFQKLLWTEEIQMNIDIHNFSLSNIQMKQNGQFLELEVPGLAEKRPSILKGDYILVEKNENKNILFKGYCHIVTQSSVKLMFSQSFHENFDSQQFFNVIFSYSRTQLRVCHQGINLAEKHVPIEIMFPPKMKYIQQPIIECENLQLYNISLNQEQIRAIQNILQGCCRPVPYIIYGPPGTGKTSTLVELIKQVHKLRNKCRVLICAPSNTAADLICQNISCFETQYLLRLMCHQRDINLVPSNVLKYCHYDESGFYEPELKDLKKYKFVVATCSMAGKLYNYGVELNYFDMIIIDEAGESWEPECLASFSGILNKDGQLIVAGDPKQLGKNQQQQGPTVRSKLCLEFGLNQSFLERLISEPAYQTHLNLFPQSNGYNPLFITKLIQSYRSHQSILKMYNELFYENDLVTKTKPEIKDTMLGHEMLLNKDFPLIFHGVEGDDLKECNSPSFFNPQEIEVVINYVQQICLTRDQNDIVIISPYKKQVEKLQYVLQKHDLENIQVSTIESIQGQEKQIVIITTVRSTQDLLIGHDKKYDLGFVNNPKRFNVAISRAQALLIVVGNPYVLNSDYYWKMLLLYCIDNHAYTGCPPPKKSSVLEDHPSKSLSDRFKDSMDL